MRKKHLTRRYRSHRDAERARRLRERLLRRQVGREPLHAHVPQHPADEVLLLDEAQAAKGWICLLAGN